MLWGEKLAPNSRDHNFFETVFVLHHKCCVVTVFTKKSWFGEFGARSGIGQKGFLQKTFFLTPETITLSNMLMLL